MGRCCFAEASSRLDCTLLARWDADYQDPRLIVTDLLPQLADVACYGMRAWIECGFKDTKRGGWSWHHTKMQDPARAERHWLVMAVATLWVVSVGGEGDEEQAVSTMASLPEKHIARRSTKGRRKERKMSCFVRGITLMTVALLQGRPLPPGQFLPFRGRFLLSRFCLKQAKQRGKKSPTPERYPRLPAHCPPIQHLPLPLACVPVARDP